MKSAVRSKRFKKGNWEEARLILSFDLEGLFDAHLSKDDKQLLYHYRLLKGNLEDLFGVEHLGEEVEE